MPIVQIPRIIAPDRIIRNLPRLCLRYMIRAFFPHQFVTKSSSLITQYFSIRSLIIFPLHDYTLSKYFDSLLTLENIQMVYLRLSSQFDLTGGECSHGKRERIKTQLRKLSNTQARRSETQIAPRSPVALAHKMVPGLEILPGISGAARGFLILRLLRQLKFNQEKSMGEYHNYFSQTIR